MTRRLAALLLTLLALAALPPASPAAAAPPPGFSVESLPGLDGLSQPTAFAFLPGGELLITAKSGLLLLYSGDALREAPVFDREASICSNSERGLLGVAVDPQFSTNRFVYVYYTFDKHNTLANPDPGSRCPTNSATQPVNRVSRLTLSAGLTSSSELVLLDNIASPNGNHNAGDLRVGKDGYLYVSIGDGGGSSDTARQLYNLSGTIVRITTDGGIPADNPFQGAGTARCNQGPTTPGSRCREIFAYGFRNPFRLGFDPNAATTRFYINDVGSSAVEEISEGQRGGDFGWNCFEGTRVNNSGGDCAGVDFGATVPPTFQYRRDGAKPPTQPAYFDNCNSITGGAFVPAGVWPSSYDGAYIFGDYVCYRLFVLFPDGSTAAFGDPIASVTHADFGPYQGGQALYFANFGAGEIMRVRYTGAANRSPTASFSAQPRFGNPPLQVSFNAGASSDPDAGDSVTAYIWDFDDGGAPVEAATPTISHTFDAVGEYDVTLRVRDESGALSGNTAVVRVDVGNSPPTPQITAPAAGTRFSVGQAIALGGSASDPEEGALPAGSLSWEVRRHHDTHYHPYFTGGGAQATFTAPKPEDLGAVSNSWLEVRLTATDALGLTATVTRELRPAIVGLRLRSEPAGLQVTINDGVATTPVATPATVASWAGWGVTLSAPAGQSLGGVPMRLCGWRHGGAPTQLYTTPYAATTLTAVFAPASAACPAQVGEVRLHLPLTAR